MKRDDVTRIFKDATDEQVSALLDINSADIGNAKGDAVRLQNDLNAANAALTTANETIKSLEAAQGDTVKLQEELERYRTAEKQAAEHAELEKRFSAAAGDRRFIHDMVRRAVCEDFGKALKDQANKGRSDADIFDALTRDQDYFASQNPPADSMAAPGAVNAEADALAAVRAAMGLTTGK